LAKLTSKDAKWVWTDLEQRCFQKMKNIIAMETLLAYSNFNKPFNIHTGASHTQLEAVVSQENKPIAFYSRKLNPAQTRYTTTERELLSIVEILKEFCNILLGQQIGVYTDHKNLTCKNFNTERAMRWRLLLESTAPMAPKLRYIKRENNIVADALSRLDISNNEPYEQMFIEQIAELCANDDDEFPNTYPLSYYAEI
jgi:RNase H-like domain found in reverse transcriptase